MDPEAACDRIAASQHGVIARRQALAAGMARGAIERRVTSGRWRAVHRGIYASRSVPSTWHGRLMAAVLFGGLEACASHRSAGVLWRLEGIGGHPVEITRPHGRGVAGMIVHRRSPDDRPKTSVIDGIPATGIERTIVDLASVLSEDRLGLALDSALRRRETSLGAVTRAMESTGGRSGMAALRRVVERRDERDGTVESSLESALLRLLRARRLPLPVPQFRVEVDRRVVARLDFAYPELRLGIEVDGYCWHAGRERWARDMRRENHLKLLGWTLLRFSWEDVHDRPETVLRQFRAALAPYLVQFTTLSEVNCTGSSVVGVSAGPVD